MKTGNNGQLRGALFEEIIRQFALKAGYREVVDANDPQLFKRAKTLPMVHGLGEGHNADVLLEHPIQLVLTPRTRVLIECKGYEKSVGLAIIRGALGLRFDLNSFRQLSKAELDERKMIRRPRFHNKGFPFYNVAVASLHGFSVPAQAFAATHHISLLDYSGLPQTAGLGDAISQIAANGFSSFRGEGDRGWQDPEVGETGSDSLPVVLRLALRRALDDGNFGTLQEELASHGVECLPGSLEALKNIFHLTQKVGATFTAILAEGVHVHMLASGPLTLTRSDQWSEPVFQVFFAETDPRVWRLRLVGSDVDLFFSLPSALQEVWMQEARVDREMAGVRIKKRFFPRVELVGPVSVRPGEPAVFRHLVALLDMDFLDRAWDTAQRRSRRAGD